MEYCVAFNFYFFLIFVNVGTFLVCVLLEIELKVSCMVENSISELTLIFAF